MAEPSDYRADPRLRQTLDFVEWLRNAAPLDAPGGAFSQYLRDAHSSSKFQCRAVAERHRRAGCVRWHSRLAPAWKRGDPAVARGLLFLGHSSSIARLTSCATSPPRVASTHIGTLRSSARSRTGLINGTAWALPSGTLIAIDDGLIVAIRHLIDTAVLFLPLEQVDKNTFNVSASFATFVERLRADNGDYPRLRIDAARGAHLPQPDADRRRPTRRDTGAGSQPRLTAQIVGRSHIEYSHLLLGHFSQSSFSQKRHFTPDVTVSEAHLDWQPEFEADRLGIELALHRQLGRAAATGQCASVYTAYRAVGLLLGVISIMEEVLAPPPSHPPAEARHTALRDFLNGRCAAGRFFVEEDAVPIGALNIGWWLIRELWQRSRSAFEDDRRDPQPPVAEVMRVPAVVSKKLRNPEWTEQESKEFLVSSAKSREPKQFILTIDATIGATDVPIEAIKKFAYSRQ